MRSDPHVPLSGPRDTIRGWISDALECADRLHAAFAYFLLHEAVVPLGPTDCWTIASASSMPMPPSAPTLPPSVTTSRSPGLGFGAVP